MKRPWHLFDVFLALLTIGAVSNWGDPSTRFVDATFLLSSWALYFAVSAGAWLFSNRTIRPAISQS